MLLPNLIILGFPKCGTRALLHNLARHPDVYTHPHECRFFGTQKSLAEYSALFRPGYRYNGEKSPQYVLAEHAMRHMAELVPDAKLFICIRHPVQFFHSLYKFRAWQFERGFSPVLDPAEHSFESIVLDEITLQSVDIRYGCFLSHIQENVLKYFDRDQIHFVVQERMFRDTVGEMNAVFRFLGLSPPPVDGVLDLDPAALADAEADAEKFDDAYERFRTSRDDLRYSRIDYSTDAYRQAIAKLFDLYEPHNRALSAFLGDPLLEWDEITAVYEEFID